MVVGGYGLDQQGRQQSAPSFNEPGLHWSTREVDENTPAREDVDSPVTATDGDTTTLTYGLEGPHADLFSFDSSTGQIRTKATPESRGRAVRLR